LIDSGLVGVGLLFANYRLWNEVLMSHGDLKSAFKQCRKLQCNVVLGDWMADDYEERKNYVGAFDEFAGQTHSGNRKISTPTSDDDQSHMLTHANTSPALEYLKSMYKKSNLKLDTNTKQKDEIKTYQDAIISRRIDLMAHVINNVEGEKIVVPIRTVDIVPLPWVSRNLMGRLTGALPMVKPPLKFDTYYERVEVAF